MTDIDLDLDGIEHYDLLPHRNDRDFKQLVETIKRDGRPEEPVVVDERGYILSGHRVWRACQKAGVEPVIEAQSGLTEQQKLEFAVRALPDAVKADRITRARIARKLAELGVVGGYRQLGLWLGVHASTARSDVHLKQLDRGPLPPTVGRDGRTYRRKRADRSVHLPRVPIETYEYGLVQAPLSDLAKGFKKASCDAIITETPGTLWADTPAGNRNDTPEFDYGSLSKLATRVLKKGAPIVIMLNHWEVDACLHTLSRWHTLQGMMSFELHGARWSTGGKTLDWRPILWLKRGRARGRASLNWPPNGYVGETPGRSDDSIHCEDLIEAFTRPGDMILDPFLENLGVLFAGIEMGRYVWGVRAQDDIDEIAELADDVLFHHWLKVAVQRFEEGFKFCESGRDELLVRRRGSRAKPIDMLQGADAVLLPLLRDALQLEMEEAEELVEPILAKLQERAAELLGKA